MLPFRSLKMLAVPYPRSDYTGPQKRTCVDCVHSEFVHEIRDESKTLGITHPLAYLYRCYHPDDLFSAETNRSGRFGSPFPCERWQSSNPSVDEAA